MESRAFRVIGSTHIDLAWKKDREEMAELFEAFTVRLLDLLDTHPAFTYVLEQAVHLRQLAAHRPDLVRRLNRYVTEGRVEVVGAMASTMETNIPNGECLIRNLLLGLRWFGSHFGVRPKAAWLIDTFGIHPQCPQILAQLGFDLLFANRFGGLVAQTSFRARGLDGTELPVIGRDVHCPHARPGNLYFRFVQSWQDVEALFDEAARAPGGPFLVMPYTENEVLPSRALLRCVERANAANAGTWSFALPSGISAEAHRQAASWPVLDADLNPEFTGTYAQRSVLRRRNRSIETQLLDAERWLTLLDAPGWRAAFEECWWKLAFVHFHDVFTGSHPTRVFLEVLETLQEAEDVVAAHRARLCAALSDVKPSADQYTLYALNSLPWARRELLRVVLPDGVQEVCGVHTSSGPVDFERDGRGLLVLADLPATGQSALRITVDPRRQANATAEAACGPAFIDAVTLDNRLVSVSCGTARGVGAIALSAGVERHLAAEGLLLVAQRDEGSFQIEQPEGSELPSTVGTVLVSDHRRSRLADRVTVAGSFPELPWSPGSALSWELDLCVMDGSPRIDLRLRIHWRGERTRIRLKVLSTVAASDCICEVPFGVARRPPYRERGTARGEWPVQRFALLEDGTHGIALINRGTCGIEAAGGALYATLLRAPSAPYAGMVPDETSSQHGDHELLFSLVPYAGSWHAAGIHRMAAERNSPPIVWSLAGAPRRDPLRGLLKLEGRTTMLSAVTPAQDGSGTLVVRLYETAGFADRARLMVPGLLDANDSTLEEAVNAPLQVVSEGLEVDLRPFEIRTLRLRRDRGSIRAIPWSDAPSSVAGAKIHDGEVRGTVSK